MNVAAVYVVHAYSTFVVLCKEEDSLFFPIWRAFGSRDAVLCVLSPLPRLLLFISMDGTPGTFYGKKVIGFCASPVSGPEKNFLFFR